MRLLLLLVSLLIQDCPRGGCPVPAAPVYFPQTPTYLAPVADTRPPLAYHEVFWGGGRMVVLGRKTGNDVLWDKDAAENIKAITSFNQKKAEAAQVKVAVDSKRAIDEAHALLNAALAPKTQPSVPSKTTPVSSGPRVPNYGIDTDKVGLDDKVTAESDKAKAFMQSLTDREGSAEKLHVTVIGSDADRAKVLEDMKTHPALAPLKGTILLQDYQPGHWAVDPTLGYSRDGSPTIMIQSGKGPNDPKGGAVLWRAENYKVGPEGLAEAITEAQAEAVRKGVPIYKPGSDPGPGRGKPRAGCPLGFTKDQWPIIGIVAVVLGLILYTPRKAG